MIDVNLSVIASSAAAFGISIIVLPRFIKFLKSINMVGTDIQKSNKPEIAEMGGPVVVAGFLSGMFLFIWINVFLLRNQIVSSEYLALIFAGMTTILMIMVIGMLDDMTRLQNKNEGPRGFEKYKRTGLRQWQKPLLTLPAAIPLMAIMAGNSTMSIPLVGPVNFGILYPLLIVPLGVVGASNAVNMLAGFNGLEAGLSFVALLSMGIFGYTHGAIAASAIAFTMAAAVLAFLAFNWYPAKILPGDSFVYTVGAAIAVIAIIGNMQKFAIYIFAPWIIEFLLKVRSKFSAENYGILQRDGSLKSKYKEVFSITHLVMKSGNFKENQISKIIIASEIIICSAALVLLA